VKDGTEGPEKAFGTEISADAFPFTAANPVDSKQRLTFDAEPYTFGTYQLRVTVTTKEYGTRQQTSIETSPVDRARIEAMVLGVTNYTNSAYNLKHADDDAKLFAEALTTYFGGTAEVRINRRISVDKEDWSKEVIEQDLRTVANESHGPNPWLCGSDDWFIFYFSGHGVVGITPQVKGRFLALKQFDPERLLETTINVSDLTADLKKTLARNYLVVLDSCFSGYHLKPQTRANAAAAKPGGKVKFVKAGMLVTEFTIPNDPDAEALKNFRDELTRHERSAILLSAAGANTEAEEGFASYKRTDRGELLDFVRSNKEAEPERSLGHGLYTFAFIANLLSQLPVGTDISWLLKYGRAPAGPVECLLNFRDAAKIAGADILILSQTLDLQEPEEQVTKTLPRPMTCSAVARVEERP
jgi:hypothetical protein